MPYAEDSLFTLSPAPIAGVLALGAAMAVLCIAALRPVRGRAARVAAALFLAWAFVWLSPQVYYAFYRLTFDDLPAQIVVDWPPPGPGVLTRRMAFAAEADLSRHGQGVLAWALVGVALWGRSPSRGARP